MSNKSDVMIDIETMGTGSDAAIIAVAAVFFDPHNGELGDEFYTNVSLQSNINAGRQIEASTLMWWMRQSDSARDQVFPKRNSAPKLSESLKSFYEFFPSGECKVWGNGSTFDITILDTAFKRCRMQSPWKFWNVRDVRTVVDMGLLLNFNPKHEMPFQGTRHNALDDSKHQAKYVSAIYSRILNKSGDL